MPVQHVTQSKWAETAMYQCLRNGSTSKLYNLPPIAPGIDRALCLMCVCVLYTQWTQLSVVNLTRLYNLLEDCPSFISHSQREQSTQLALHFIGKFVETSYTGVQVLLWAGRKNVNQAKSLQGKLVMKKCFLRGHSCQAKGPSDNRRNLFCHKRSNPSGILKMRGKCGCFQYCHRDFVWPWNSGLTPPLNHNFSLPPKAERWKEHLRFLPTYGGIRKSRTLDMDAF